MGLTGSKISVMIIRGSVTSDGEEATRIEKYFRTKKFSTVFIPVSNYKDLNI